MEQKETRLHQDMYIKVHNERPFLRGLFCYNNNNSYNRREGAKNRSLGIQPGRSDFVLYWNSVAYMIEVKTPEGSQSEKQIEWENLIKQQGFDYIIVRSVDELLKIIDFIIKNDKIFAHNEKNS